MTLPAQPKLYHIAHVDRLPSIIGAGYLWCDAEIVRRAPPGTTIGGTRIKERRLTELRLASHPALHVGDCVPFYFCAPSIMLYLIYQANHAELIYRGGQGSIVHLQADLHACVAWAEAHGQRWAFTLSNAGSRYFEDRCNLAQLQEIDWQAVQAMQWQSCKEGKQAEFLLERRVPWHLIERIGVQSLAVSRQVADAFPPDGHRPIVEVRTDWYY